MFGKISLTIKSSLRRMLLSIALVVGCTAVSTREQLSYGQDFGSATLGSSNFSQNVESDSDSLLGNDRRSYHPRERGTVGTLFRWSAIAEGGKVAQLDEPLISDRPDFTESSTVV